MRTKSLIVALLILLAFTRLTERWMHSPGIDFFQFWGVGKAPGWTPESLGSPYSHAASYLRVLDERFGGTPNPRLQGAREVRDRLDLTGTPLLYALFGVLPGDYGRAFGLYQVLQVLAFLGSMYLIARTFPGNGWVVGCFALVALLACEPLASDVRVGNVNAFQLATFAALAFLADRWTARSGPAPFVFMGGLTALVLVKPNVLVAAAFFAAHVLARYGARRFVLALVPSAVLAVFLIAAAGLRYGGWEAWNDWFATVAGTDRNRLVYPVALGNCATGPVAAHALGLGVYTVIAALAALLAGSAALALVSPGAARDDRWQAFRENAVLAARDPRLMLSAGLVAGIALAPLAWDHYLLVILLPALWLMLAPTSTRWVPRLAGLSILLLSGMIPIAMRGAGLKPFFPYFFAVSWMPLWAALLLSVTRSPLHIVPMARARAGIACIAVLLFALVPSTGCRPASSAGSNGRVPEAVGEDPARIAVMEARVHERLNSHRESVGLAPLIYSERIAAIARRHSESIASGQVPFSHEGFEARATEIRTFMRARRIAENVHWSDYSPASAPDIAVDDWLDSAPHRANIEGDFQHTGVGVAAGSRERYYFTQIFVRDS